MIYVCELLTHEPEGSSMIPLRIFLDLYGYLANLDCGDADDERQRRKAERADTSNDATTSVLELSSNTIDLTTKACSCEFTATEKEEMRSTDEDTCGKTPHEKQPSKSFDILKDYGDGQEHSNIDIVLTKQSVASDKTEIEIESIDGHVFRGKTNEVRQV
ncbi:uncharacterized protein LOC118644282 [Monomorium pharaonis]|uniref:uncharacterized protein LOC118644282 n=1 Tax=Monomorium pharaonis TaxID=307658 RepID=UPI0017463F06|nr:uncharacterized protein LOC118644282 [Monomorium pharaonis]